jgi:hypothetical protein
MFGTVVGFGVFRFDEDTNDVVIEKLAVKPTYRRKGASQHLLAGGIDYAKTKAAKALTIIVPESTIYPVGDQPSMIGKWLASCRVQSHQTIPAPTLRVLWPLRGWRQIQSTIEVRKCQFVKRGVSTPSNGSSGAPKVSDAEFMARVKRLMKRRMAADGVLDTEAGAQHHMGVLFQEG